MRKKLFIRCSVISALLLAATPAAFALSQPVPPMSAEISGFVIRDLVTGNEAFSVDSLVIRNFEKMVEQGNQPSNQSVHVSFAVKGMKMNMDSALFDSGRKETAELDAAMRGMGYSGGIRDLAADFDIDTVFDPAARKLVVNKIAFGLQNMGNLEISGIFEDIPNQLLPGNREPDSGNRKRNPMEALLAAGNISMSNFRAVYRDQSLGERLLNLSAQKKKVPVQELRNSVAAQMEAEAASVKYKPAAALLASFSAFLRTGTPIVFEMAYDKPVKLLEVFAMISRMQENRK